MNITSTKTIPHIKLLTEVINPIIFIQKFSITIVIVIPICLFLNLLILHQTFFFLVVEQHVVLDFFVAHEELVLVWKGWELFREVKGFGRGFGKLE